MQPLLTIEGLHINFTTEGYTSEAVKSNSFTVNKGELVAIVGESGSGKSVTALSILQLLPKQSVVTGKALFFNGDNLPVDLLKLSAKEITSIRGNEIAMIFQEPMTSLNPVFTCGYQVMEAIQLHQKVSKAIAKQKTIALFEKVKLPGPEHLINRYPHELSGGQKQRVMIAMAMCCNPSLLIADEPTTALDVTVQKTILVLIKSLQTENNMGVIFITHDLGVVADIADKIIVMRRGEIVEQGFAKDILQAPKHPYTKALLACRPAGKAKGKRLPVVSDFFEQKEKAQGTSYKAQENAHQFDVLADSEKELQTTNHQPQIEQSEIPTTFGTTVLELKNLQVHFPTKKNLFGKATQYFKAVDDVSFKVEQGDIIGLVGESGCGKTTLGRSILQLIKPTAGKILLDGKDLTQTHAEVLRKMRKNLQIVFQDPYGSLNPRITIGDAILEPLKVHSVLSNNKQRKEKVMELLEKVSLDTSHFNRYPHQFSGGQRQRICIARALALNPSFLIFDESVSALDVSVQAQVLNLLNDLKAEFGFTAIFISHDLSVVHYICNRILVMYKGKIVEEGTADQVYHHPANEYTKKLISAIPGKSIHQFS